MSPRLSDLFLRSQSDERLVSLARAGHDRAFASIVQRYRPELLALARQLRSDGHAEDLLQQAFLSAFAALRSGADVRHLRGWLYQIVRNAATKAKPPADLALDQIDVAGEPLEETVLRRARALAAMSELARLPERQRGALVATALGNRAHAEVAASMGLSEQAVRQLVHRARVTLRGVVTGITPWPIARWLATVPTAGCAPEVAVSAAAGSSAGAVVKLAALLAASGALATGVAAGPLRPMQRGHVSHAPATRTLGAAGGGETQAARPAPSPDTGREDNLGPVTTANAGVAVEDPMSSRRGGAGAGPHRGDGSSESGPLPRGSRSEGSGSGGHDGQAGSGASPPGGSDSGGLGPGASDSGNPTTGASGGEVVSGHDATRSVGGDSEGSAPVSMAIENSPSAATFSPHWRPSFLPAGGHEAPHRTGLLSGWWPRSSPAARVRFRAAA